MRAKLLYFVKSFPRVARRPISSSPLRNGTFRVTSSPFSLALALSLLFAAKAVSSRKASVVAKEDFEVKEYSEEEVARHSTRTTGIWVSFRGNVYDITNYVRSHPGGVQAIMLAAGKDLEPFWALYSSHVVTANARNILEKYRIGKLSAASTPSKPAVPAPAPAAGNPAYANDPVRHPSLHPHIKQPFIAEPPTPLLTASYITPADIWFVVNHLPVPDIDAKHHSIQVSGEGIRESVSIPLDTLKSTFKVHKITAALQCGGNRRTEMTAFKPTVGIQWGPGSISNAEFTGVLLRDVLNHAGFNLDRHSADARHIQFEGLDTADGKKYYGASIPVEKAVSAEGDVLLAWEMNGEPLSRDHGYPLRVVVPGTCAVRSVKWVKNIIVSKEENESYWQRVDYKAPPPYATSESVDWSKVPAIQALPVTSAITEPKSNVPIATSQIFVKGYAYSGDGHAIHRVDITTDEGKTWTPAEFLPPSAVTPLVPPQPQAHRRAWAWTQWKTLVATPEKTGPFRVCAKATDDAGNTQPEGWAGTWNFKGYNVNSWACVNLFKPEAGSGKQ